MELKEKLDKYGLVDETPEQKTNTSEDENAIKRTEAIRQHNLKDAGESCGGR